MWTDRLKEENAIWYLLAIFLILGSWYAIALPIFEAADEVSHYRVIEFVADEKSLPHIIDDGPVVGHEAGQPPLYYTLLAPFILPIDRTDFDQVVRKNPHFLHLNSSTVWYHLADEIGRWRGTVLAVFTSRLLSLPMGVLTIWCTWALACAILPDDKQGFALLTAGFVAFNPQFLAISGSINNDNLVIALCSLALYLVVGWQQKPQTSRLTPFLIGITIGLAVLSKISAIAFGGVIAFVLLIRLLHNEQFWIVIHDGLLVTAGFLLPSGWWFWRNQLLYGDPLGLDALSIAHAGTFRDIPLTAAETLRESQLILKTFWLYPGNSTLFGPDWFYWAINLIVAVGIIGWLVPIKSIRSSAPRNPLIRFLWEHLLPRGEGIQGSQFSKQLPNRAIWPPSPYGRGAGGEGVQGALFLESQPISILWVWSGLIIALLFYWISTVGATSQGRLMYPALSALAVLVMLGFWRLGIFGRTIAYGTVGFLAIFAIITPSQIIRPAFANPAALPSGFDYPNSTDANSLNPQIELLGHEIVTPNVSIGEQPAIRLFWQATAPVPESYYVTLHFVDTAGTEVSRYEGYPVEGRYPTNSWQPNHPFVDDYLLPPISDNAEAGLATIFVELTDWRGKTSTEFFPLSEQIKVRLPEKSAEPDILTDAIFGELANLQGYTLKQSAENLTITLFWQAQTPTTSEQTVFVHLIDQNGELVAQGDGPPRSGTYPTTFWEEGEQIPDIHHIQIGDVDPGEYKVAVGFYDPISGARLPVRVKGEGRPEGFSLPITILP